MGLAKLFIVVVGGILIVAGAGYALYLIGVMVKAIYKGLTNPDPYEEFIDD